MKSPEFYTRAPSDSPDRFVVSRRVIFTWRNPPEWIVERLYFTHDFPDGKITFNADLKALQITVDPGFYFDVSVAPSFRRAMAAACLHDWLYSHAKSLGNPAIHSLRTVLHCADHWFLA